jgi:two-component system response regulator FixJ
LSEPYKVHVVDDDQSVRDALLEMLNSIDIPAVGFASAKDFLEFASVETAGCLISDIRMPGMSGLELQKSLQQRGTNMPTIFITGHADVPMAVEAIQQGAVDFIEKPFREQDLLDRIQKVMQTAKQDSERQKELKQIHQRLASLSEREREVLEHISEGHANKVIAIELGISQRTVENHRAKLLEKLNVRSTAGLIKIMVLASTSE